jgi:hypothetical protein
MRSIFLWGQLIQNPETILFKTLVDEEESEAKFFSSNFACLKIGETIRLDDQEKLFLLKEKFISLKITAFESNKENQNLKKIPVIWEYASTKIEEVDNLVVHQSDFKSETKQDATSEQAPHLSIKVTENILINFFNKDSILNVSLQLFSIDFESIIDNEFDKLKNPTNKFNELKAKIEDLVKLKPTAKEGDKEEVKDNYYFSPFLITQDSRYYSREMRNEIKEMETQEIHQLEKCLNELYRLDVIIAEQEKNKNHPKIVKMINQISNEEKPELKQEFIGRLIENIEYEISLKTKEEQIGIYTNLAKQICLDLLNKMIEDEDKNEDK